LAQELRRSASDPQTSHLATCVSIAALLPNKLARDVAIRVRWLKGNSEIPTAQFSSKLPLGDSHATNVGVGTDTLGLGYSRGDGEPAILSIEKLLKENTTLLERFECARTGADVSQADLKMILDNLFAIDSLIRSRYDNGKTMPRMPVRVDVSLVAAVFGLSC
jgi:hypothetical protein